MLVQFLSATAFATVASAQCSRVVLNDLTAQYLDAQTKGLPDNIFSIKPNATYTEQFKPANIATGILSKPLNIDSHLTISDVPRCAAFTQIIITTPSHPYVIGSRIEVDPNSLNISKIETLVTDAGDWLFNATGYAYYQGIEHWDPIPDGKQDSRSVIQAAGDAYFNLFANANTTVPWGTPCARLEGGAYTGAQNLSANTCNLGVPQGGIDVVGRRYVVDEEMGAVNIYLGFPGLDRASKDPTPDSHTFRIEQGKIRYIHTLSTCEGHPGCGLNSTFPGRRML